VRERREGKEGSAAVRLTPEVKSRRGSLRREVEEGGEAQKKKNFWGHESGRFKSAKDSCPLCDPPAKGQREEITSAKCQEGGIENGWENGKVHPGLRLARRGAGKGREL